MITWILMGFWHGANWTFLLFGLIHACYLIFENRSAVQREKFYAYVGLNKFPGIKNMLGILITFTLLCFSIFFFRAGSIGDSLQLISGSFNLSGSGRQFLDIIKNKELVFGILNIVLLLWVEQFHAKHNMIKTLAEKPVWLRWGIYVAFIFYLLMFGVINRQVFIYFQF